MWLLSSGMSVASCYHLEAPSRRKGGFAVPRGTDSILPIINLGNIMLAVRYGGIRAAKDVREVSRLSLCFHLSLHHDGRPNLLLRLFRYFNLLSFANFLLTSQATIYPSKKAVSKFHLISTGKRNWRHNIMTEFLFLILEN